MGLETGTYISDLVQTNPAVSDQEAQGANHLQLIKKVLQNTFPGASLAFPFPTTAVATSPGLNVTRANWNTTFLCNTSGGQVGINLPALTSADAGWECSVIKTTTDTSPVFISPPSGTIQSGEISGLSYCRRCIPGARTRVLWTGSAWIAERVPRVPVGSLLPYSGSTLPVGYEWPNGQTLSSAGNYPEIFAIWGALVTPDLRGRTTFGVDNMGGSAAGRITVAGGNFDGTVLGGTGGGQNVTIGQTNIPNYNLNLGSLTFIDAGHAHTMSQVIHLTPTQTPNVTYADGGPANLTGTTGVGRANISIGGTLPSGGSNTPLASMNPTIMMNYILVTE